MLKAADHNHRRRSVAPRIYPKQDIHRESLGILGFLSDLSNEDWAQVRTRLLVARQRYLKRNDAITMMMVSYNNDDDKANRHFNYDFNVVVSVYLRTRILTFNWTIF